MAMTASRTCGISITGAPTLHISNLSRQQGMQPFGFPRPLPLATHAPHDKMPHDGLVRGASNATDTTSNMPSGDDSSNISHGQYHHVARPTRMPG